MKQATTRKLVTLGVLCAVSIVLLYLIHFPILPGLQFLEYDPADIPIFLTALAFGPAAGLVITVVASVIQGFTVSAQSGVIGILMHILATGSFVLTAGLLYRRKKTRPRAVLALLCGTLVMTVTMMVCNWIFIPIFNGTPRQVVVALLPMICLFNLIKAGVNALLAFFLYQALGRFIPGNSH